jgi:hypothetical protein
MPRLRSLIAAIILLSSGISGAQGPVPSTLPGRLPYDLVSAAQPIHAPIFVATFDLDGDSSPEVATAIASHSDDLPDALRLTVWRGSDGEELASAAFRTSRTMT